MQSLSLATGQATHKTSQVKTPIPNMFLFKELSLVAEQESLSVVEHRYGSYTGRLDFFRRAQFT